MPDEQDFAAAPVVDFSLAMNLRHKRTGRVERDQIASRRLFRNGAGNSVRRENHRHVVIGNFTQLLDENRTFLAQTVDDIFVVHDLVSHIDWRPIDRERPLNRFNRTHHAGAESARRAEQDFQSGFWRVG